MENDATELIAVKKPRLRWFQFRLRTMFVVTTLFALWFGNEMNFIHERAAMRLKIEAAGGSVEDVGSIWFCQREWVVRQAPGPGGDHVPAIRLWLGDRCADTIYLPHEFSESDQKRVMELFPDSQIACYPEFGKTYKGTSFPLIIDLDGRLPYLTLPPPRVTIPAETATLSFDPPR